MGRWDGTKKFLSHGMGRLSKNFRPIPSHEIQIKKVASHGTDGMGLSHPTRSSDTYVIGKIGIQADSKSARSKLEF